MKRTLTGNARNAIFVEHRGLCGICGKKLDWDWQLDHIVPFALGGPTVPENLQPACKECNMKKGDKMLRKHQEEFIQFFNKVGEEYKRTRKLKSKYCFAEIFPGGGKSLNAISAFKLLKEAGVVDRLLWIVPRKSLKTQGAEEFLKPFARDLLKHNLEIRELNKNQTHPCRDTDGYITSYQMLVADKGKINEMEMDEHRYLVYIDECHHICEEPHDPRDQESINFYNATKKIVEKAAFVVGVSGTMYRHDATEKIAYLPYKKDAQGNVRPQIDIEYPYPPAYSDKAVIPCIYRHYDTKLIEYNKGGVRYEGTKLETREQLRVALGSEFAWNLLNLGLTSWEEHRLNVDPRSKLIIIGDSQQQCRIIGEILERKKISYAMAISDEEDAHNNIKKFRTDPACNVLVTCQMAYEGLDCKQATHLICLTRIRSIPWLIQAITRVMRYDDHKEALPWEEQRGYVFVPNDKEMLEALKRVGAKEGGKALVIDEFAELDMILSSLNDGDGIPSDAQLQDNLITGMKSEIGDEFVSDNHGLNLTPELLIRIRAVRSQFPGAGAMNERDFYNMLKQMGNLALIEQVGSTTQDIVQENEVIPKTAQERETELRQRIEKLARKCDYGFRCEHGTWNKKAHNHFRYKSRKDMGEKELKEVLVWMETKAKEEAARLRAERNAQ